MRTSSIVRCVSDLLPVCPLVHLRWYKWQNFILSHGWATLNWEHVPLFLCPSLSSCSCVDSCGCCCSELMSLRVTPMCWLLFFSCARKIRTVGRGSCRVFQEPCRMFRDSCTIESSLASHPSSVLLIIVNLTGKRWCLITTLIYLLHSCIYFLLNFVFSFG